MAYNTVIHKQNENIPVKLGFKNSKNWFCNMANRRWP